MSRTIAQDIQAADKAYALAIDAAATRLRAELIVPYCDRWKSDFTAGHGQWEFWTTPEETLDRDRLPKRIRDALELETYNGQSLGSLCLDYRTINRSKEP